MTDQEEVVTAVAEPAATNAAYEPPPAQPPPEGDGEELDIGRFLGALDRGKYFIALLSLCATLAGYLYVDGQTPRYRAGLDLAISPGSPEIPEDLKELTLYSLVQGNGRSQMDPKAHAAILTSRQLAQEAVKRLALHTSPLFAPTGESRAETASLEDKLKAQARSLLAALPDWLSRPGQGGAAARIREAATDPSGGAAQLKDSGADPPPEQVVALAERYRASLTVQSGQAEGILRVSYVSTDPVFAALAANTTADLYIERRQEVQDQVSSMSRQRLRREVREARQRLLDSEKELERFRQAKGLSKTVADSVPARRLAGLKSALVEASAEREDLKARREAVISLTQSGDGLTVAGPLLESELLRDLRNERLEVERRIEDLQARFRDAHPRMKAARRDLASVKDRIRTEIDNVKADLDRRIQGIQERMKSLNQEIASLERTVDSLRNAQGQMRTLISEVASNREHYRTLLDNLRNFDTRRTNTGSTRVAVINRATVPDAPFAPNPPVVIGGSFLMATLAGIALVLGLELMQKGLRRLSDLERRGQVEPMGVIPRLRLKKDQTSEAYLLADVTTTYAESIRNLRTGLTLFARSQSLGTVLVTSALNGEGKSTIARALAVQAADAGQKAIVVDCDFHQGPGTTEALPGIADYLRGEATLDEGIARLPGTGADYLGPGCNCRYPDEIYGAARFPGFLKELERRYDHVFLDGPALLVESDVLRRANLANLVLLIVRWGMTSTEAFDLAVQRLREANAPLLTGALTRVDLKLYAKYESGAYKALTQIPSPSQRAIAATESRRRQDRFQIFG